MQKTGHGNFSEGPGGQVKICVVGSLSLLGAPKRVMCKSVVVELMVCALETLRHWRCQKCETSEKKLQTEQSHPKRETV